MTPAGEPADGRDRRFRIDVAKDAMAAYLSLSPLAGQDEAAGGDAEPLTVEAIVAYLRARGVKAAVDEAAIAAALANPTGSPVVVASGTPPTEPQPGWLESLFPDPPRLDGPEPLPDGSVDYRSIRQVPTVQPGTAIAIVHHPVPGKEGIDLFGQPVRARLPARAQVFVGQGADVSPDGRTIVAKVAGRPFYGGRQDRPLVKVVGVHLHEGDVTATANPVRFAGDLVVTGSLREGARVAAEGSLKVVGDAAGATVEAGQLVEVGGTIAHSRITVGGVLGVYTRLAPLVEALAGQLAALHAAVLYLTGHPAFGRVNTARVGFGQLLQVLVQNKFPSLWANIEDLTGTVRTAGEAVDTDLVELSRRLTTALAGPEFPRLRSAEELAALAAAARTVAEGLRPAAHAGTRVKVGGAVRSTISCSGDVHAGPDGLRAAEVSALGEIAVEGPIAGGSVYGRVGIAARELGCPKGTLTCLRVGPAGVITAAVARPGTVIRVGDAVRRLERDVRGLEARLAPDGTLRLTGQNQVAS